MEEKMKSVSLKTKLLFGAGDMYGGGAMNLINFFYLIFDFYVQ